MREIDLLMSASYLLTMDDNDTRMKDGAVAIEGNKIVAIGKREDLKKQYQAKKEIHHENAVLMPGLIDAHCHETLTRGLHEDLPLMRWLEEVCYPVEGSYLPEDMTAAAMMTQMELIHAGVTSFIDIFRFADKAIDALGKTGLRCIFTPQFFDATQDTLESIDKTVKLVEKYHGSQNGRVQVWFGPHSPYSVCDKNYARAAKLAKELGIGVHTHLSETRDEVEIIRKQYGKTPTEMMRDCGVFDVPSIMAHSIHLTDGDIQILADHRENTGAVYCPISNLKIADGIARLPDLLKAGVTVGLGTDSNLSNNGLDMFNEMRIGSFMQKTWNNDPTICPCGDMLKLATRGSAKVFHMEETTGSLEVGKLADVICVSFEAPHMWPIYYENPSNIKEQLVYSARGADVITTVVDGRVLMDNREILTCNEKDVFAFVQDCATKLYARAFPDRMK